MALVWSLSTFDIRAAGDAAAEMAGAAQTFLGSLGPEAKAKATFEWQDDERLNWHFIPKERAGLTIKEMTPEQRHLALALVASGLSAKGQIKAMSIMALEKVLQDLEGTGRRFPRDPELYHFLVFGQPGSDKTWGWRVEGHHLSLNFTIANGQHISVTPSFMGTNPAEVRDGGLKGLRVLALEEDLGRELINSLTAEQRKDAVVAEKAPADIITGAARKVSPLEPAGIGYSRLNAEQKELLQRLIGEYVGRYRAELAENDLAKIRQAGLDKVSFAWAGGLARGEGHYYRVQGPTFLLEYDCTQNDANHIHAVWRDFENDFGADLLRQHYESTPHDK